VNKLFYILVTAIMASLLSGCPSSGSSASPPPWLAHTAGDGRVKLEWTPTSGVDYWLFTATDPKLTAFNWTSLPRAYASVNAATPFYMCGLINDVAYYFATNGRVNGGPGGTSSPTITATPYNAVTHWLAVSPASGVASTTDLYGVSYASQTTCGNNAAISATGMFAAVGTGGAIFTSNDGLSWSTVTPLTPNALNAVSGYAANQNNTTTPALRWMAVGDAGAVVYYEDGNGWVLENSASLLAANPSSYALRSVTQVGTTFFAVGDAGTIISSADAISWTHRPYNAGNATTNNLNGIAYGGGLYVAVGDNGTLLTSGDGNTWAIPVQTPALAISANLHKVTAFTSIYGNIYVAVGAGGTIVTRTSNSYNNNTNWTAQSLPIPTGSTIPPNLVGVTAESRGVDITTATTTAPAVDPKLGFISSAQFVAVDDAGNAYASVNGYDWPTTILTGASGVNAVVSSGFGYIVTGSSGVSATAF